MEISTSSSSLAIIPVCEQTFATANVAADRYSGSVLELRERLLAADEALVQRDVLRKALSHDCGVARKAAAYWKAQAEASHENCMDLILNLDFYKISDLSSLTLNHLMRC